MPQLETIRHAFIVAPREHMTIALMASFLPARRATIIAPLVALRAG